MSTNTTNQGGFFVSTGANVTLPLRADIDWMRVLNYNEFIEAATEPVASEFYWQKGLPSGSCFRYLKSDQAQAANLMDIGSRLMYYVNSSLTPTGVINATITAVSNDQTPVVTNTGINGLVAGDVVRLFSVTDAEQLGGIDFTVGNNVLSDTQFTLDYMFEIVAGTDGSWMKVAFDPIFYPRRRTITFISQASNAKVFLSVTHGYQVGQLVRMIVPDVFSMTQMNGLQATIIAIDTDVVTGNSITLDIDSTSFNAFTFPLTIETPFTPAEVVPMGENTAAALNYGVNILSDATVNTAYIGMKLISGAGNPAGVGGDKLYWSAGTFFGSVDPL